MAGGVGIVRVYLTRADGEGVARNVGLLLQEIKKKWADQSAKPDCRQTNQAVGSLNFDDSFDTKVTPYQVRSGLSSRLLDGIISLGAYGASAVTDIL